MHLVLQATSMSASRDLQEFWRGFSFWFTCVGEGSIAYQRSGHKKKKRGNAFAPSLWWNTVPPLRTIGEVRKLYRRLVRPPLRDALSDIALQIITSYLATTFGARWSTLLWPCPKKKKKSFTLNRCSCWECQRERFKLKRLLTARTCHMESSRAWRKCPGWSTYFPFTDPRWL